ncbi:triose-phosphate isomerase [Mycoplasmopsis cynos]|uniref:triose-phosphate isomerase n=1 Tax=Mycoplasmopsis cynos TaxID=171284 RepID=UPI003A5C810F
MNKKIIIGNWKMNKTFTETVEFLDKFSKIYREKSDLIASNLNFGIATPYTNLAAFKQNKVSDLKLSAQDVSMHNKGAYTGEVSISMLKDLDVEYVVLGTFWKKNIS